MSFCSNIWEPERRSKNSALILLNILFQYPLTTIDNIAKKYSLSYKAANDLFRLMQEKQVVEELTGQSPNRLFIFKPYLDIFYD